MQASDEHEADVSANHHKLTLSKIQDVKQAVYQEKSQGNQGVDAPGHEPVRDLLGE
jgi:hypothetical protein